MLGVLTGGSAGAYWAPNAYQSADADFVLTLGVDPKKIVNVMQALEFRSVGGIWVHPRTIFTVEFPPGPPAIGGERINCHESVRRAAKDRAQSPPTLPLAMSFETTAVLRCRGERTVAPGRRFAAVVDAYHRDAVLDRAHHLT